MATVAANSFSVVNPTLVAETVLQNDRWWHLGGFCFGKHQSESVARLIVRMIWKGENPLGEEAKIYLVAFDGREEHWGIAQKEWETAGCDRKLQIATDSVELHEMTWTKRIRPNDEKAFAINIKQKSASRDWHYALMACGTVEAAPLKLTMEAVSGALSYFGSGENFDESSCPVMPTNWWAEGQGDASFWLLLCAIAMCSACLSIVILLLSKRLLKASKQTASPYIAEANEEVVIGKPCQAVDEGEIANGQVNLGNAALSNQKVPLEDVWGTFCHVNMYYIGGPTECSTEGSSFQA